MSRIMGLPGLAGAVILLTLSACAHLDPTPAPGAGSAGLAQPLGNTPSSPEELAKCGVVGGFLARNIAQWQAADIYDPSARYEVDPTGLNKLLSNPDVKNLLLEADRERSSDPGSKDAVMTGDVVKRLLVPHIDLLRDVLAVHEAVRVAHQRGGFLHLAMEIDCKLRAEIDAKTAGAVGGFGTDSGFIQAFIRFLVYDAAYTNAFIRNGNFGTYSVAISGKPQATVFGKVSDSGFVTRFGTKYQFQDVSLNGSIKFKPGEPLPEFVVGKVSNFNYLTMESGFIRVFLEAVFDAKDRLPAVAGATGTAAGLTAELSALGLHLDTPEGQAFIREIALPDIGPGTDTTGTVIVPGGPSLTVTSTDMSHLESVGNNAEAVGSAVLEAIPDTVAGFSIPAVHQFVQTAFAVTARKVAEKASWCLFASSQGGYPGCVFARPAAAGHS